MPPSSPGSLGSQAYTDVAAYLLRENGESAGSRELSAALPSATAPARSGAAPRLDNEDAVFRAAVTARKALLARVTPVSDAMLRAPPPADWLMWRGSYATLGYSSLAKINRNTVHNLGVTWTLALPQSANETAPLIHDGVLFIESANTVEAIDATRRHDPVAVPAAAAGRTPRRSRSADAGSGDLRRQSLRPDRRRAHHRTRCKERRAALGQCGGLRRTRFASGSVRRRLLPHLRRTTAHSRQGHRRCQSRNQHRRRRFHRRAGCANRQAAVAFQYHRAGGPVRR